jgi:predicted CxxxxCH...CXXCH cytochrome family protein
LAAVLADAGCVELRAEDTEVVASTECTSCHGSERPGSAERQAAPPVDVDGNTEPARPGVGAHDVHLTGSSTHGPIECVQCHQVPTAIDTPGHTDSAAPAEFVPGQVARLGGREPEYDAAANSCSEVYCHRSEQPVWVAPRSSADACGTCHSLPPPLPHEQVEDCERCHGDVVAPGPDIVNAALHVNGGLDVVGECYDCHGTPESFAPPPDTHGATDPTVVGVGAHQIHLSGTVNSRPVPCETCHRVPAQVGSIGHIDGGSAEVEFSGVALAESREPVWDPQSRRCANGWCHGPDANISPSPLWTVPSRGPLLCDGCHQMPPPPPHTQVANCQNCHAATVAGLPPDVAIVNRDLHVNGVVDM